MPHSDAYLLDALRLPVGKANGLYKTVIPEKLTAHLLRAFAEKYPFLPGDLDEMLLATAVGTGGNPARYALLEAGFSPEIPATTLDFQCGGGLRALVAAAAQVQSGQSHCLLAGGMESASLAPRRQYHPRDERFAARTPFYDRAAFAPPPFEGDDLLLAAENAARLLSFSKEDLLAWTAESHRRAAAVLAAETLKPGIVPWEGTWQDQPVRPNLTVEALRAGQTDRLTDHTTAAHRHDGAALLLLASGEFCERRNLRPPFRVVASALAGGPPHLAPLGVIWATEKLLNATGLPVSAIDVFEVNESFAVKPLAFARHWGIPTRKINSFGGNLAYGHPFGASGAMNTQHLMQALIHVGGRLGLVTAAAAGGLGVAVLLERIPS
jgi:acetyl-CoA C-acetyltransferase